MFSPQHRILFGEKWAKAKHLADIGLATWDEMPPLHQWYGHILLKTHEAIAFPGGFAESMLPSDRALTALKPDHMKVVKNLCEKYNIAPVLTRGEYTKKELRG